MKASVRHLQDIGFYTLSDDRAARCSSSSPLWRCELLLTDRCNFACPYCRGMRDDLRGTLSWENACRVVDFWMADGLRNVRFSGGEPTCWPRLADLCVRCRAGGVQRIAISTNGSADTSVYEGLLAAGVNDFSVSLDACCASVGDKMAGGKRGAWARVVESIRFLSARSYTTVGMVFTEDNWEAAADSVLFADSLGVSDIRVVPSAQFNKALTQLAGLPSSVLAKYPILRYRIANVRDGRNVRTMCDSDCGKCRLALDDMAVAGGKHFPCIIHLREGGDPIGAVGPNMRAERERWVESHDSHADPICRKMCLDVCIDYNNMARDLSLQNAQISGQHRPEKGNDITDNAKPAFAGTCEATCSAQWAVELNCDCPKCGEYVNLLDAPDFWDGRTLDIPEHGTENSNNVEVVCPECGKEFKVCCEW